LGDATRKNFEQIALEIGDNTRNLQLFISQSPRKTELVIAIHQWWWRRHWEKPITGLLYRRILGCETRRLLGGCSRTMLWIYEQDR